jgi:hypothetical protein
MTESSVRPCPIEAHPLKRRNYILPTPPLDEFCQLVRRAARLRMSAPMVYGDVRYGKTYAIRYAAAMVREEFPSYAVVNLQAPGIKASSKEEFYSTFLQAAGHAAPESGSNAKKKRRVVETLLQRAADRKGSAVVLFVDEAQKWSLEDYEELRDIHDQLERHMVHLIVVLVGQPALRARRELFRRSQNTQVTGRFMVGEHAFRGLRDAADVATCLMGYDESYFPEGSEWSYTRFFFPRAWAEGFRLQREAQRLYWAFSEAYRHSGLPGDLEVPMQYLAFAIHGMVDDLSGRDCGDFGISAESWGKAVDDSGFVLGEAEIRVTWAE